MSDINELLKALLDVDENVRKADPQFIVMLQDIAGPPLKGPNGDEECYAYTCHHDDPNHFHVEVTRRGIRVAVFSDPVAFCLFAYGLVSTGNKSLYHTCEGRYSVGTFAECDAAEQAPRDKSGLN